MSISMNKTIREKGVYEKPALKFFKLATEHYVCQVSSMGINPYSGESLGDDLS